MLQQQSMVIIELLNERMIVIVYVYELINFFAITYHQMEYLMTKVPYPTVPLFHYFSLTYILDIWPSGGLPTPSLVFYL